LGSTSDFPTESDRPEQAVARLDCPGPKRKRHGKYRKGLEQRRTGIATGEKLLGDGGGQETIDGEIEPLDEIADTGRHDHSSQGLRADLFRSCARHA
jgi:hypothetical protein